MKHATTKFAHGFQVRKFVEMKNNEFEIRFPGRKKFVPVKTTKKFVKMSRHGKCLELLMVVKTVRQSQAIVSVISRLA